jgi:NTE family protein
VNDAPGRKAINLALQGGGAHGAFTWGVLDRLIEDGRLDFEAISGTSAGAMNAVVLADGFARDGAAGARDRLEAFWKGVSREGMGGPAEKILAPILAFWHVPNLPMFDFSRYASPYSLNPLNVNPLRDLLDELVDFKRVRANGGPKLFISATNVRNGKIKVFSGKEVTAEAVMASACLPHLFKAVEIDGEAYWDGGYSGNPALFPFFTETKAEDILLVQINPAARGCAE